MHRTFVQSPFIPEDADEARECFEDVLQIQTSGLAKRWEHTRAQAMIVGISGGLDSTLALLVTCLTADRLGYNRKQVIGVTMPGFGTSDRTYHNAIRLMEELGVSIQEISIRDAVMGHFEDINHDPDNHDITYENAQARERTQILMDLANKYNGQLNLPILPDSDISVKAGGPNYATVSVWFSFSTVSTDTDEKEFESGKDGILQLELKRVKGSWKVIASSFSLVDTWNNPEETMGGKA